VAKTEVVRLACLLKVAVPLRILINRFHNPLVKAMVARILEQGPDYYSAIQQSAKTAQEGRSFAKDAIDFCKRLIRAEDSPETLKSGLDNIKEVAKRAYQGSEEMERRFKCIRTELFRVRHISLNDDDLFVFNTFVIT